jgi:hypothetical protein
MGAEFSACPHTMIRLAMARRARGKVVGDGILRQPPWSRRQLGRDRNGH